MRIEIYDTTLRDGAQGEDVSFSLEDKLLIASKLDWLGVDYIEGGWPDANPKDAAFFREIKKIHLRHARVVPFGSTCKASNPVEEDPTIRALLDTGLPCVTIFGKCWDLHVKDVLSISLKKNLQIVHDSVSYLRKHNKTVFFDAEHFFDGYKENRRYALQVLKIAEAAGAARIILCDTNGGTMPWEVAGIVGDLAEVIKVPLGIHSHNDSEVGAANALAAVKNGVIQVQGTINGYGERCGNANLCSVIPVLRLKMEMECLQEGSLERLKETSRYVDEIANLAHNKRQPFVGDSAFAHKGGIHVHAVMKNPRAYEHIKPEIVGNKQNILISDYSGKSNLIKKIHDYNIDVSKDDPRLKNILHSLKSLENQGFQFEGAEASFELMIKKALGIHRKFFELIGFRVIVEKRHADEDAISEATIMLRRGDDIEHTVANGDGPVHALDNALRKALETFYPELRDVRLIDYKVRVLSASDGSAAKVRVLIESGDHESEWGTVGVSEDIIEASWQALVDSIDYKLLKNKT